ncbi:MAG: hypothetical protein COB67_03890 [SAR324 cluster bacterium]|uniref:Uncharacterized protein n=1 Tax=SAR324 cluster bacterium TaxID=2024889 RepID=A0A2A4T7K0_9DELT|nr:MAG: hypothetical protein COB67_03890 [SAR324 cluster bacterium]
MRKNTFLFGLIGLLLFGVAGCSGNVGYHPGIITQEVTGIVASESIDSEGAAFILVLQYNQTFLDSSQGRLKRVTAKIVHPDSSGHYRVRFDNGVSQLDLIFIKRQHLIASKSFSRTLGISSYEYHPLLRQDSHWEESFFFSLKPMLSEYITEERFFLPDSDQLFLGQWLNKSSEKTQN